MDSKIYYFEKIKGLDGRKTIYKKYKDTNPIKTTKTELLSGLQSGKDEIIDDWKLDERYNRAHCFLIKD